MKKDIKVEILPTFSKLSSIKQEGHLLVFIGHTVEHLQNKKKTTEVLSIRNHIE